MHSCHFHKHQVTSLVLFPMILITFWYYLQILSIRGERELRDPLGQNHPYTVQTSCPKSCCKRSRQSAWEPDGNLNPSSNFGVSNSFHLKQKVCLRMAPENQAKLRCGHRIHSWANYSKLDKLESGSLMRLCVFPECNGKDCSLSSITFWKNKWRSWAALKTRNTMTVPIGLVAPGLDMISSSCLSSDRSNRILFH